MLNWRQLNGVTLVTGNMNLRGEATERSRKIWEKAEREPRPKKNAHWISKGKQQSGH